ncbi:hypothetical protein ABT061_45610 [Streptosporangium sp. NPDC002544]|uniref:hypothetical protein n=1 Tax=Streptosporangium sp. NPDC002544 TaxID=3154538 RepID=UPI00331A6DB2
MPFTIEGHPAGTIRAEPAAHWIAVSAPSPPRPLQDVTDRGSTELVRTSVRHYNIEEELDRFCDVLYKRTSRIPA